MLSRIARDWVNSTRRSLQRHAPIAPLRSAAQQERIIRSDVQETKGSTPLLADLDQVTWVDQSTKHCARLVAVQAAALT